MADPGDRPDHHIVQANERELARHGDNYLGAGYTRSPDEPARRYRMMLDVVRGDAERVSLLDLGCGLGHLYDFVTDTPGYGHLDYTGLDMSAAFLDAARARRPGGRFVQADLLSSDEGLGDFDYVLLNGLFNYRGDVPHDEMDRYWERMLDVAWRHCRVGLAFNVMSKLVDWEREDLFHVPFERVIGLVSTRFSRHFVLRHDYGDFEYTTYVYRGASPD